MGRRDSDVIFTHIFKVEEIELIIWYLLLHLEQKVYFHSDQKSWQSQIWTYHLTQILRFIFNFKYGSRSPCRLDMLLLDSVLSVANYSKVSIKAVTSN